MNGAAGSLYDCSACERVVPTEHERTNRQFAELLKLNTQSDEIATARPLPRKRSRVTCRRQQQYSHSYSMQPPAQYRWEQLPVPFCVSLRQDDLARRSRRLPHDFEIQSVSIAELGDCVLSWTQKSC